MLNEKLDILIKEETMIWWNKVLNLSLIYEMIIEFICDINRDVFESVQYFSEYKVRPWIWNQMFFIRVKLRLYI